MENVFSRSINSIFVQLALSVSSVTMALFSIPAFLSLQFATVGVLLQRVFCWYYLICASFTAIGSGVILNNGQIYNSYLMVELSVIALLVFTDAMPQKIRLPVGRWGCSVVALVSFFLYFDKVLNVGMWFTSHRDTITEVRVDGIVSISMWDIWIKTFFVIGTLSLKVAFASWRHPESYAVIDTPQLHRDLFGGIYELELTNIAVQPVV